MNMQNQTMFRQCQAIATEEKPNFVCLFMISKKSKDAQIKSEFQNLASKKPNWYP